MTASLPIARLRRRRSVSAIIYCGLMGLSLAAMHALFSLCLITPAYFAKYFGDDGRLNWQGELGWVTGIVALWALAIPAITTLPMMPRAIGGIRWIGRRADAPFEHFSNQRDLRFFQAAHSFDLLNSSYSGISLRISNSIR